MTDKINELKALIETLEPDSTLRKQLEEALAAEQQRQNQDNTTTDAEDSAYPENNEADNEADNDETSDRFSEGLDTFMDKLDDLLEDDKFVAATAGFLLGAVSIGLVSAVARK